MCAHHCPQSTKKENNATCLLFIVVHFGIILQLLSLLLCGHPKNGLYNRVHLNACL
jgi:hypothetical protein